MLLDAKAAGGCRFVSGFAVQGLGPRATSEIRGFGNIRQTVSFRILDPCMQTPWFSGSVHRRRHFLSG